MSVMNRYYTFKGKFISRDQVIPVNLLNSDRFLVQTNKRFWLAVCIANIHAINEVDFRPIEEFNARESPEKIRKLLDNLSCEDRTKLMKLLIY